MMEVNKTFQELFNTFLQWVQDADRSAEITSYIGPTKSAESMFQYLWGLKEAHQICDFEILESIKSQVKADLLRIEGNIHLSRGQLGNALHLYNMSISFAPIPPIKVNIKEVLMQGHEQQNPSLAYGLANRSAILFDLEEYEKAINEIDLAIMYGYPIKQIFRLFEIKAKCLLALEKHQEAKTFLHSTLYLLSMINMDEDNKITIRNKLLFLLNNLQQDSKYSENNENIPDGSDPIENLINLKLDDIDSNDSQANPKLDGNIPRLLSQHASIPSVSSALRLEYTSEQGRFFVADRDIKPGDLILVEKSPYSCLHLKKDVLYSHCCVCLMRCFNPIPCNKCTMMMFCSKACQSAKSNGHNHIECMTLQTLESLHVGNCCLLAFKVITHIPYEDLKLLVAASKMHLADQSPNLHGFNSMGVFDSLDFTSLYSMINNQGWRDSEYLLKRVCMAFILTKLLIKSNCYFIDETGSPFHPTEENIILLGSTFITLIMSAHCNFHAIGELQTIDNSAETIRVVGAGVFPTQSLLNHSCNPSTIRSTIGSHMTSYALRYIPKGSEVTDSYGCHYAIHDIEYRQASLKRNYCFDCKCEACTGQWTIVEDESFLPKFKPSNNTDVTEGVEEVEYMKRYKELKTSFHNAYFNLINGVFSEESKKIVTDFIEFFDKYVIPPCKLYHDIQGVLKCFIDVESSGKYNIK